MYHFLLLDARCIFTLLSGIAVASGQTDHDVSYPFPKRYSQGYSHAVAKARQIPRPQTYVCLSDRCCGYGQELGEGETEMGSQIGLELFRYVDVGDEIPPSMGFRELPGSKLT